MTKLNVEITYNNKGEFEICAYGMDDLPYSFAWGKGKTLMEAIKNFDDTIAKLKHKGDGHED